jgi:hypothetical protein
MNGETLTYMFSNRKLKKLQFFLSNFPEIIITVHPAKISKFSVAV